MIKKKYVFLLSILVLVFVQLSYAQNLKPNFIVRGKITEVNGEPIPGATVLVELLNKGTSSNDRGEFTLYLPEGENIISISSIGYKTLNEKVFITSDTILISKLNQEESSLGEVVVRGDDDRVRSLTLGQNTINLQTLKKIPPLLGEPDLIRSLLLIPGVSTVGEGATGFNVRGGGVDQNLVLLDDAPIFNTSHLFGFITAFNTQAVSHADLFKGGMPARYGGRTSSVLDIKLKQGNSQKLAGNGSLGLMNATAMIDGPIGNKTNYLISLRSSYSDWLLKTVPDRQVNQSNASFYDGIAKLTHSFNNKHSLSFTSYISNDSFQFPGDTVYGWRTQNFTFKWSATLSDRVFLTTSLVSSDYSYRVRGDQTTNEFQWKAGIQYYHAKSDLLITYSDKQRAEVGIGWEHYETNQGDLTPKNGSNINPFTMDKERAMIGIAFYNHQINLTNQLALQLGLRGSWFNLIGPGGVNTYADGQPISEQTRLDRIEYSSGETIKTYYGVEPRGMLKYSLGNNASLKFGFDRTVQYLHLVSNTSAVSPIDLWKLSGPFLKPQRSNQVSAGYFRSLPTPSLTFSFEAFYKWMENVVDYKDGATLLLNEALETDLLQGKARAYGAEWMLEKSSGKFTGWIAYTLSRTERKMEGAFPEETINKGQYYPANYDKLHNLNLTGSYQKSKRISWGFNFVLNSGRPITYPTASYRLGGVRVVNYELRNNQRTPAYHRLDISLTIKSKEKIDKRVKGEWIISLYNVYARKNPYSIFFRSDYDVVPRSYRLAVIGTIIPSLSYQIKF